MLTILSCLVLAHLSEPVLFSPPAFSTFDGSKWAGITLEKSLARDVLKDYKAFKGAFRPGAMLLNKGETDGVKSETLNDRAGSKSIITGFRISYFGLGESGEKLAKDLGAPTAFYPAHRYEDWRVMAWPDRGIAFSTFSNERGEFVREAIVTTPARLRQGLSSFSPDEKDVEVYRDPFADQPRVLEYGYVNVSYSVRGLKIEDESRDRDDYERELIRLRAGDYLRYRRGSGGTANLTIDCSYSPAKGGRVSVTASMEGRTVYGPVHETATVDRDLEKVRPGQQVPVYLRYTRLADEALHDLEDKLAETIRRQGPPPKEYWRARNWLDVIEGACPSK